MTYALGAVLLALLIAWATGALKNTARRPEVWIWVAVLTCANVLLVATRNALPEFLGIVVMAAAIIALFRLRFRSQS